MLLLNNLGKSSVIRLIRTALNYDAQNVIW